MNRLNDAFPPALYRVGGRLYKTTALTSTDLRLEDLLDGQCLVFTRDQARQMLQQQDLIKVKHSSYRRLCHLDPRYRPHLPSGAPPDDHEPLSGPAVQQTATMPWPPLIPRETSADPQPARKGAEERPLRCPRLSPGLKDGAALHLTEHLYLLIADEFNRRPEACSVTPAKIRFLMERYAQVQRLKPGPDRAAISRRTQQQLEIAVMSARIAREERWRDEGQVRWTKPIGWLRLKPSPPMTGHPALIVDRSAITRPRPTEFEQRPTGAQPSSISGAALDRLELPPAHAGGRPPPAGAEDDVE
jgi:hypothetical protein